VTWTQAADLVGVLRKRWDRGSYLQAHAAGEAWAPVTLPVKGPSASDLLGQLDTCRRWIERFAREARVFNVEYRTVQSRHLGANQLPARVRVDSFEQLCRILGTSEDVRSLDDLMARTQASSTPELTAWVARFPLVALDNQPIWDQVLATVGWIRDHPAPVYIRQIDLEGVDTKFVERNHRLLDQLLSLALPGSRVDDSASSFVRKFRFLEKPGYTRLRMLDDAPLGYTEMTVRTDELAIKDPGVSTVFVVENEVTYLAFPRVPDAVVVFGSGFGLAGLANVPWLHDKEIVYWGDIDTYGFDILDRLRSNFQEVRSILMDRETLLAHSRQWVTEPSPTNRPLAYLTAEEAALYRDLVEGVYGRAVRLEQERVRFSLIDRVLRPWRRPNTVRANAQPTGRLYPPGQDGGPNDGVVIEDGVLEQVQGGTKAGVSDEEPRSRNKEVVPRLA
jgi:hypothetical protein